jgi:hypothetical protein
MPEDIDQFRAALTVVDTLLAVISRVCASPKDRKTVTDIAISDDSIESTTRSSIKVTPLVVLLPDFTMV